MIGCPVSCPLFYFVVRDLFSLVRGVSLLLLASHLALNDGACRVPEYGRLLAVLSRLLVICVCPFFSHLYFLRGEKTGPKEKMSSVRCTLLASIVCFSFKSLWACSEVHGNARV